jgi:rhodanese-related sulfurtransferase
VDEIETTSAKIPGSDASAPEPGLSWCSIDRPSVRKDGSGIRTNPDASADVEAGSSASTGSIYLCQHAVRSKATLRNGAAEVSGGFVAWRRVGLPVEKAE